MKQMKQILALLLTFLIIITSNVMAAESTNEADFSYGINAAFRSRDLIEGYVLLTGTPGTDGDIKTICYLPIYYENTSKLTDIFSIPISIEDAFSQGEGTSGHILIPFEIRVSDPTIANYRLKAIMVDSSANLQPRGKISSGFTNEIALSNVYYPIFVEFDTLIKKVPLQRNQTTLAIPILAHVYLWEGAIEKGYTEEDFRVGESITLTDVDMNDFYDVQGLYCRIRLDLSNDGGYQLQQIEPLENYNKTVAIKPIHLINAKNSNNQAEYYASDASEEASYLPLAESVTVYKNYGVASFYDVVPGKSDYITEYRYVDTDIDGLYETVYIDSEEVFLIGSIMLSSYRMIPDFDAMRTFTSSSLVLNPDDSFTNYDINIPFGTLKPGQIVRVKQSEDAGCIFYKVNVQDPKTVIGEVTNVVTTAEGIRYTIDDTDYRMLVDYGYPAMEVGDMVKMKGYEDVIVDYEFTFNAKVGVILEATMDAASATPYQVRIMKADGTAETYALAETVNGRAPSYANSTILQSSLPNGVLITYQLNEDNRISAFDTQSGYSSNTLKNGEEFRTTSGSYRRINGRLGGSYITENTLFFVTSGNQNTVTEDNLMVSVSDILTNETDYSYGVLYDTDDNALAVLLYETSIEETEEVLSDISYGVVTGYSYTETFEPVCTLELLNQNGEKVSCLLDSDWNESQLTFSDASAITEVFPLGELIAYRLDEGQEIKVVDTLSGICTGNVLVDTRLVVFDTIYQNGAFGDYLVTDSTRLTGTSADKAEDITKDNCAIVTSFDLAEGGAYQGVGVINASNQLLFSFTYQTTSSAINPDSYPIVITKRATVTPVGDTQRVQYLGYVNGEDVTYLVAENAPAEASSLENGDVALYQVNRLGEISQVLILAKKTENGYTVLDNAINGAEDDSYTETAANKTFLSTANYSDPNSAEQAKAVAESMMSTQSSNLTLAGFAAAGKGYATQGGLLRLMNPNDYPLTFGSDERDYSTQYYEDRIKDYYVDFNCISTYRYNAKTDKITISSLYDLETDSNTYDYRYADQLDNDDFVYVYHYDGETKLIFIIDVMGDNL